MGLLSNFDDAQCGREVFGDTGVAHLFEAVIISAEVGLRKPNPRIYRQMLEMLRLDAAEVLFVGDTPREDVAGPQEVGMQHRVDQQRRGGSARGNSAAAFHDSRPLGTAGNFGHLKRRSPSEFNGIRNGAAQRDRSYRGGRRGRRRLCDGARSGPRDRPQRRGAGLRRSRRGDGGGGARARDRREDIPSASCRATIARRPTRISSLRSRPGWARRATRSWWRAPMR